MTTAALVCELQARGVELASDGAAIRLRAPRPTLAGLTAELREELARQKPILLGILPRLEGMRANPLPIPTARPKCEAPGGPGRCFSCNDALEHVSCFGRCMPCDLAAEIFYRSQADETSGAPFPVEASR
jgi:hypothetical protein